MMGKKVYISGPISGLERGEVEASFAMAEDMVRRMGHETVSPLNNGLPYDASWECHMKRDLEMLGKCDMLFLIQTEHTDRSAGCRIELLEARRLGMEIMYSSDVTRFAS